MSDLAAVEARLQRLEDLAEINQLFIDYGVYLDAGEFASYASLFAADGEVKLGPMGRAKGPADIQALMERVLTPLLGTSYHVISSPVVKLDGDTATSKVMWTVVARQADGQPYVSMVGKHHDELVRENGRWRIKSRRGTMDIPSTFAR